MGPEPREAPIGATDRRIAAARHVLRERTELLLPLATHFGPRQPSFESAIRGSSMWPAIPAGSRLQVQPLGDAPCRRGDIVYFLAAGGYTVHRVVFEGRGGAAHNHLLTRGD